MKVFMGPPAPGCKVGDFIKTWLMGSCDRGLFTHREIALHLVDIFSGLKIKEPGVVRKPTGETTKKWKTKGKKG